MNENYTFEEFKAVLESGAYEKRFRGRESVIYLENGGPEFYNEEALTELLDDYRARLDNPGTSARNRWVAKNMVAKVKSWMKQAEWIENQMELNRRKAPK